MAVSFGGMYWLLCEVRRVRREYKILEDRLSQIEGNENIPAFIGSRNGPEALLMAEAERKHSSPQIIQDEMERLNSSFKEDLIIHKENLEAESGEQWEFITSLNHRVDDIFNQIQQLKTQNENYLEKCKPGQSVIGIYIFL